mgnify:CR=1 FL=1
MEEEYAKKSLSHKSYNIIRTVYNNLNFLRQIAPIALANNPENDNVIDVLNDNNYNFKDENKGLYVIIHGLNGTTCTLGQVISKVIKKRNLDYDIVVPKVPQRGNCSLKDASNPIYKLIKSSKKANTYNFCIKWMSNC